MMLFTPTAKAEASPMEESFVGNPIIVINLTYEAGTGGGNDFQGEIVLELFLNWGVIHFRPVNLLSISLPLEDRLKFT